MLARLLLLTLTAIPIIRSEGRYARIPDWTVWFLMTGAVAVHVADHATALVLLSASLGLGIPLFIRALIPGGLGWGDAKLSLALFLLLGPVHGLVGLFAACLIALCGVGVATAFEGFSPAPDAGLPFGPSMIAGAIVALTVEISI